MSLHRRRETDSVDIWPGFVDALSTVLLVFIFVIVGFISSQLYLSGIILDKDSSLTHMEEKISNLCSLLDSEKCRNTKLNMKNTELLEHVSELKKSIELLDNMFSRDEEALKEADTQKQSLEEKITVLTAQLQEVLVALSDEKKNYTETKDILSKMKKENIKLNELAKFNAYRSEFFDKLHKIVGDKEGIKIVGDRFVFQSELFFESASADLSDDGKEKTKDLAEVILEISKKIPSNINWILRVDGHTDKRPISGKFASNWELSAARAISVVKQLISDGVPASHLVAAGFGENQPISNGNSDTDFSKNRRIEFKLDER